MSSESSSRMRQFGLYKTIDSKTEEFLKLSRKRQIRRGCACAAVSTAITVTVVVGALLVYEFAFRADLKTVPKASHHSSWFNEATDTASFDKHSPIKSHGKLLAIILKALDQKQYLEAIVDDEPQPEHSTAYPYQKNVFSDARSQKATRYKPLPFTQNRGRDSMDKAKKIMDYHRVLTYLNSKSFIKNTGAEAPDISSTQQPYRRKKKYKIDELRQNNLASTAETKRVRNNVKTKPNITVIKQPCCTCPSRSNLTGLLGKLYKSIQELGPRLIKSKSENAKINNNNILDISTTVKTHQPKYPFGITTRSIKTTKRTTTINPELEKATYEYSTVFNIKSRSIDGAKSSTSERNEITTKRNVYSSKAFKSKQSFMENLVPPKEKIAWKLDFSDVVYDDTANDNAQLEFTDFTSRNNSTNENNTISDIIVKSYTTPSYAQYDFDDKIDNLVPGFIQIPSPEFMKKEKTSVDTDFVNYLSSLNKLKTLIVYKPQTLDTSKENARLKEWNIEQFLIDEEVDPPKFVVDTTEKRKVQEVNEEFYEKKSLKTREKPGLLELESGSFIKENYVNSKSTTEKPLQHVANMADEKLPLPPMMQAFLMTKKESGLILNLDETTTTSIKLQTDPVEDLPFNTNFYEDYEDVNSLKTTSTSTTFANKEQNHDKNIDDHATSLKKHTKIPINEAQQQIKHYKHLNRDEDVSTLKTYTITSTNGAQKQDEDAKSVKSNLRSFTKAAQKQYTNRDEIVSSFNTNTKASFKEAQKEHINRDKIVSSVETQTRVSTDETQPDDTNRNKNVSNVKTRNIQQYNVSRHEHGSDHVVPLPKHLKKIAKLISRIQSLEPAAIRSPKLTEAPTNLNTPKTKEVIYMTGNETPIDDFETDQNAMMYFDASPFNYTALANSFLNKNDSTSIETSNSMMPQTRTSHLEIRRNHELFDRVNWYTNGEQNYGFEV